MKQENFSTTLSVTSTYAGENAGVYISAALLSASTLDNNLITVHPNVKYKEVITKFDASSLVSDASCDFVAGGNIALSEVILEPKRLQVNLNVCKSDFISSWEALSLGMSANNNIPANFNDFLISHIGGKIAEATETSIWAGVSTNNGEFDGIVADLTASEDTLAITGSTITSENVMDVLEAVYATIPATLWGKEDLRIFVSQKVAKAYFKALADSTNGGYLQWMTVDAKPLNYQGVKLEVVNGLGATDTIVAAQISNLHFGTGLMSDFNQVKVIDMSDIDGSDNYRIVVKYSAGVKVGVPAEAVLYTVGA